jgi:hypothetical protein
MVGVMTDKGMRVLVSGRPDAVTSVAGALRAQGAEVTEVTDLADMPDVCTAAGEAAFDSYVQLPSTFQAHGETAIARVHHFYADGVLARFPALAAAVSALAPGGRVTFVLGQLPPEAASADDRAARLALCQVLGHAATADAGDGHRLVVRVLEAGVPAADVAFVALGGDLAKRELLSRLSTMDYHDWRVELMGLAAVET